MESVKIQDLQISDRILSYDNDKKSHYLDQVTIVNKHQGYTGQSQALNIETQINNDSKWLELE